jgi:diguanylate cyclase (GGDEF)-like protein
MKNEILPETNVLLVMPDAEDLMFVKQTLLSAFRHYVVTEAESLSGARWFVTHRKFAVALVDLELGAEAVMDFVRFISRQSSHFDEDESQQGIPSIVLTGYETPSIESCILETDIADSLNKFELTPALLHRSIRYAVRDFERLQALKRLAHYDPLTGLANRNLLYEHLLYAIERGGRQQELSAVFFLDLDRFKWINDSFGHDVGDKVLCEFAWRLKQAIRKSDFAARLGGDEFVIVAENLSSDSVVLVAEKIIHAMRTPLDIGGNIISLTTSIGITFFPKGAAIESKDRDAVNQVLREADQALYLAKKLGRNRFCLLEDTHLLSV